MASSVVGLWVIELVYLQSPMRLAVNVIAIFMPRVSLLVT
jgi:hypothetical protein